MKEIKWTLGNIIDFEYFVGLDRACGDTLNLKKRDRKIYLEKILPTGVKSGRKKILMWLEAMKEPGSESYCRNEDESESFSRYGSAEKTDERLFPGDMFKETISLLKALFAFGGFAAGVSICLTFFSYTGKQPLNVSYFLALTIFPQLLLLTAVLFSFTAMKLHIVDSESFSPYPFISSAVERVVLYLNNRIMRALSGRKRAALESALGVIRRERRIYGYLFFWPIFIMMQLFGVAFNAGVLSSTIFRILFFDTAFGWQSTLQMSENAVSKIVAGIAMPWGWLLPGGIGFPDPDQISGSRIILKDGIYHLTTPDLVSWWPFLCLAILFYGFLPRLIMLISGKLLLEKDLQKIKFDHADCAALLDRMSTPDRDEIDDSRYEPASETMIHDQEVSDIHLSSINPSGNWNPDRHLSEHQQSDLYPSEHHPADHHPPEHHPPDRHLPENPESEHNLPNKHLTDKHLPDHHPTDGLNAEKAQNEKETFHGMKLEKLEKEKKRDIAADHADSETEKKPCIALIPVDMDEVIEKTSFIKEMGRSRGYDVMKMVETGYDFEDEIEKIALEYMNMNKLRGKNSSQSFAILVLQEAWLPPIKESVRFLKDLREAIGERVPIIVLLSGKPVEVESDSSDNKKTGSPLRLSDQFDQVDESDRKIWNMKLSSLGDPWLAVERMIL